MKSTSPREYAIPGVHERLLPIITRAVAPADGVTILDLGAGEGALSERLLRAGYAVSACDLFPEMFKLAGLTCDKVDAHERLPYADEQFDAVAAVEVVEHLESHSMLFAEVARVLKPGGKFIFSTPNISSLKSRVMFLFTGYFYSHGPLDPREFDPVGQHISAFTPDRYRFVLARNELDLLRCEADKYQKSSIYLSWLVPFVRLAERWRFGAPRNSNPMRSRAVLYGRTLVGIAQKRAGKKMGLGSRAAASNPAPRTALVVPVAAEPNKRALKRAS